MKKSCLVLVALSLLVLSGCGSGGSTDSGTAATGKTYYAAKYTNGYATSTNGPFSSLNSCQEFLASSEGRMPAWIGASCIESSSRP